LVNFWNNHALKTLKLATMDLKLWYSMYLLPFHLTCILHVTWHVTSKSSMSLSTEIFPNFPKIPKINIFLKFLILVENVIFLSNTMGDMYLSPHGQIWTCKTQIDIPLPNYMHSLPIIWEFSLWISPFFPNSVEANALQQRIC
jgi:hypothetical protein